MRAIGALVVIVMSSSPAWADATDAKAQADKLFIEGRELLEANPAGACAKFHEAQDLQKKNVAILLNLGLCYEKQGKHATALRWYRKTQTEASENKDPAIKEYEDAAKARTQELSGQVSRITFSLGTLQPNAEILVNGETINKNELIVEVDQGTALIEARAPGKKTMREELPVETNDKQLTYTFNALADAPIPKDTRGRRRLLGALIGGGIVAVTSGVAAVMASKTKSDFDDPNTPQQDKDKLNHNTANIIFGTGLVVGVGIAAYFFFTKPKVETSTSMAITPVVSDDQVGVSLFRRF